MSAPPHIRILTVEDSPLDAELIDRELRRAKLEFAARRVETEQEFREALASTDPDVILADYNLPHFDGSSALKIARELVPETPFIFVSGSIGEERAVLALREGATDYILKDRLSRLPAAILRALDERRERQLRKRGQEMIERLSRQNELILNSAAEGIVAVDLTGKPLVINPAAEKITGFSLDDLKTFRSIHAAMHHSRPDGTPYPDDECPMFRTLNDGVVRISQELYWRKSGEPFPAEFACSPIYEDGVIAGCVVLFQDITERQRLEKRLEQSNRVNSLGRVAATIAHEFNNVLMGIQPFAELIHQNATEEKVRKAANHIVNSVTRGKRVTQSVLRFTQPADPKFQAIVLTEWLPQLLPELRGIVGNSIAIDIDAPKRSIIVRGDAAQLQQVVTNLVINARDAMPHGGKITLTINDQGGSIPEEMALLSVRDTGSGIPSNLLETIFEPLFTTKRSGGTGLGLAVAQQVIDAHGGTIRASSTPGEGTTFSILLPTAAAAVASATEARPGNRGIRRVLLVDDDETVASGIAELLRAEGIKVRVVHRGNDAAEAAATFDPDAVILDLNLPDMNGVDVYTQLHASWPDLPILFSTGHGDEAALERQVNSIRVGFLRKPFSLDVLLDALERISASWGDQATA
jgi:PAS domain S-box-containing protein